MCTYITLPKLCLQALHISPFRFQLTPKRLNKITLGSVTHTHSKANCPLIKRKRNQHCAVINGKTRTTLLEAKHWDGLSYSGNYLVYLISRLLCTFHSVISRRTVAQTSEGMSGVQTTFEIQKYTETGVFLDLLRESPRESEMFIWSVQRLLVKPLNKIRNANRTDRALHWGTIATLCPAIADRTDDCKQHWHTNVAMSRNGSCT